MTDRATVVFAGQTFTYDHLFTLSGPELVKLHNTAAPKAGAEPTKRFSDKVAAAKRTWAVLTKISEVGTVAAAPSEKAKEAAKPAAPKKEAKPKVERSPRGKYFMFPARPVEEQKEIKEKTLRGTLYHLMRLAYGATFEQLYAETWATKVTDGTMTEETALKTTYEAIRLVHYFNGFGIYHAANDHLFVWSTQAELKEIKGKHEPKGGQ